MDSSLQKAIDHASVVSFDVFDTLIKRNCANPTDIFTITEKRFNRQNENKISGFKNARIEAERYARTLEETGEIDFDAIYDNLNFPHKDELKQLELICEEAYCVPNKRLKAIYDYCVEKKKTMICISDMYLPSEIIRKILENAGYHNIKKIYVSNEYKKTKRKGNLFDEVLKEFSLKPSQLVHIGDSWRSDYLMPKMKGIKAFHFSRKVNNVKYGKEIQKQEGLNIIGSVLNNTTEEGEDFYRFGYEVLGPFCVEFCLWIKKQMEEQGKEKLFFCARDMQLMQSIFCTLFPSIAKQCKYLYVSRRSIIFPYLCVNGTWDGFLYFLIAIFKNKFTISEIIDYLITKNGLSVCKVSNLNYSSEQIITIKAFEHDDNAKKWFYKELYPVIQSKCIEQCKYLKEYLSFLKFAPEDSLVIDVGWRGTVQSCLKFIFQKEIYAAYIGLGNSVMVGLTETNARSFAFDARKRYSSDNIFGNNIPAFATMFEKIISAQHGTTIGYNKESVYELGKSCLSQEITQIHLGAIDFAEIIKSYIHDIVLHERPVYFESLMRIILSPTYKEARLLGDLVDENFQFSYFSKPKPLSLYIMNPKVFVDDFFSSSWKIGFLRRLLKMRLPYFKLYILGTRLRKTFTK